MWVVGGLTVWLVLAVVAGVVIGRGIRLADVRTNRNVVPDSVADLPGLSPVPVAPAPARVRRRAVPLPPVGIALAALAVALETTGYVTRLVAGSAEPQVLSMDAPGSLPRLYVTALFAAAAVCAVAGAARLPGRRAWWLAVGLVAGGIAAVKAGATVHATGMTALGRAVGDGTALLLAVLAAAAVLAGLWWLSRTDRRDRRRVLGVLAGYAFAAVGLSALSGFTGRFGATWYAAATYLEESGEALAGVAFLVAVLVGVAPRLVLPADWALRRAADVQTLDAVQPERRRGAYPAG